VIFHPIVNKSIFSNNFKFDNEIIDTLNGVILNGSAIRTSATSLRNLLEV